MAKKKKRDDISNTAVVVMLAVVILVSVVSLGVYMNTLDQAEPGVDWAGLGKLSLTVKEPVKQPTQQITDGGKLSLTVAGPK